MWRNYCPAVAAMILNIFYTAKLIYFSRYGEIFALISKNMLPMSWVSPHSLQHRYLYLVSEVFLMRISPTDSDIWTLGSRLWCYLGRLWNIWEMDLWKNDIYPCRQVLNVHNLCPLFALCFLTVVEMESLSFLLLAPCMPFVAESPQHDRRLCF